MRKAKSDTTTVAALAAQLARDRQANRLRFQQMEEQFALLKADVSGQIAGLREWLQGWVLRQEIELRRLRSGQDAMRVILGRIAEKVGVAS